MVPIPFFMTHFIGPMPISSIGGIWIAKLRNFHHALSHVCKVIVAVDASEELIQQ